MSKEKLAIVALWSLVIFHFIANFSGWYLRFEELDKLSHFWGGFALAAILLWQFEKRGWRADFWKILGLMMAAAIIWEVQEFILDKYIEEAILKTQQGPLDTFLDVIFGLLGAGLLLKLTKLFLKTK